MAEEEKKIQETEKHLENLINGTHLGEGDAKKAVTDEYEQLYQAIVASIKTKQKYGKTTISDSMRDHYAAAMAKIAVGGRKVTELYRHANEEVDKKKISRDKKGIATYIREIAKMSGHPMKYADIESDDELISRIEAMVDGEDGSGKFRDLYQQFKENSKDNQLLDMIRGYMEQEHTGRYQQTVLHGHTFELDADQRKEMAASHGRYMSQYGIKSIKHESLAADHRKLHGRMIRDHGSIEQAIRQSTDPTERYATREE